ncbi:MAG: DNA/RNA nuclease SfsA [Cyanobacterium sp. T60_A2020_053]|nr:DNA/RNA nuclease SfsA [Cyanobacterium sp. T60_A2020_053]
MIYQYPTLREGKLLKRYKRFLADIELDNGEIITAHCANTGPMIGVCDIGSKVQVSVSDNPKRKLPYSWEMIAVGENSTWVGINTSLPNRIVKTLLENQLIENLAGKYDKVKSEVKFGHDGKSRIDFVLTGDNNQPPIYLEVKNTTLSDEPNIVLFPDTETTRGQKHLQELIALTAENVIPVMLYFINRNDCEYFAVGSKYDLKYGNLFAEAREKGVMILPCRFEVTPQGVSYLGLAKITPVL